MLLEVVELTSEFEHFSVLLEGLLVLDLQQALRLLVFCLEFFELITDEVIIFVLREAISFFKQLLERIGRGVYLVLLELLCFEGNAHALVVDHQGLYFLFELFAIELVFRTLRREVLIVLGHEENLLSLFDQLFF